MPRRQRTLPTFIASTAGGLPWISPFTLPAGVLATHPTRPSCRALSRVQARKNTPWTCKGAAAQAGRAVAGVPNRWGGFGAAAQGRAPPAAPTMPKTSKQTASMGPACAACAAAARRCKRAPARGGHLADFPCTPWFGGSCRCWCRQQPAAEGRPRDRPKAVWRCRLAAAGMGVPGAARPTQQTPMHVSLVPKQGGGACAECSLSGELAARRAAAAAAPHLGVQSLHWFPPLARQGWCRTAYWNDLQC